MDRTIPTVKMLIQEEIDMLQVCKRHTHACGQAVRFVPFHTIRMSLILEQRKRIALLSDEIMAFAPTGAFRVNLR